MNEALELQDLALVGEPSLRRAAIHGARWLQELQLWRPGAVTELSTGSGETAAVLLSGTFDLRGNQTVWPARGARQDPLQGRPMAVYLPPQSSFGAANGDGEILLVSARQPAAPVVETGRQVLANKPLLPLAGSGKSYDPNTGEWRPAETFPEAAESLPPRRMQQLQLGAVRGERIFASDYKAATLTVEEWVLPAQSVLPMAEIPARAAHDEVLLYLRSAGSFRVASRSYASEAALWLTTESGRLSLELAADQQPLYVLCAYAGKGQ